jgi:type VI secretion system secreted protein VgrG
MGGLAMALDQARRHLSLATPLRENVLVLTAFRGREEMSRPFSFELEMISDNNAIAPADIVGQNVTIGVERGDGSQRYFNGFVRRFAAGDESEAREGRRNYYAEIVPWLWFLQRTTDLRIFQHKNARQIIEQVFQDLGFTDFEMSQIRGAKRVREYCVQYREADLNFVSRLMKEEGVYFFFRHENGKHVLVMADEPGGYEPCAEAEVDFPDDFSHRAVEDHFTEWRHSYEFHTGRWAQTDYNFKTPSLSLMTNASTVINQPGSTSFQCYDYPGIYPTTGDGRPLTDLRQEEEEVDYDIVHGASTCKSFHPGGVFKVVEHRSKTEAGKSFVLTCVEHSAIEPLAYETGIRPQQSEYPNRFACIPSAVPYRPGRFSPKPFVKGPQTAVVVGPKGEEIYTDKYGRVKVQFHWDREGKRDGNSSLWIRCMQTSAGRNWGALFLLGENQQRRVRRLRERFTAASTGTT